MTLHDARIRIQIQYIEMPGLKLTLPQIARLCDVPLQMCESAIDLLVHGGFLTATPDGIFLRRVLIPGVDGVLGPLSLAS